MEDYAGACAARHLDILALLSSEPQRCTAAVHIGGIAVECQIKALVLNYHGIDNWSEQGRRSRDPYYRKPVERPGHHLLSSVKLMARLYEKAKSDSLFIKHLDQIMHPAGSRDVDFINLRYSSYDLDGNTLSEWRKSLDYVSGWLKKNEVTSK
jgi:hypothetical protein